MAEAIVAAGPRRIGARVVLSAFVRRALLEGTASHAGWLAQLFVFAAGAASFVFLARLVDAAPNPLLPRAGGYTGFLLIGIVAADLQRTASSALPVRVRDAQIVGTLESMLAAPAPTWMLVAGLALPDLLFALARNAAYLAIVAAVAPDLIARTDLVAAAAALALGLAAFAALGLLGAAFTLLLRRSNPLGPLLGGLSIVAGGVLYPTAVLPSWLQPVCELIPLKPALDALRAAVLDGAGLAAIAPSLLHLAVFTIVLGPAAAFAFGRALARARQDGSLASY